MFNFARVAAAKFVIKTLLGGLWNKAEGSVTYSAKTSKVSVSFILPPEQYEFIKTFLASTVGLK